MICQHNSAAAVTENWTPRETQTNKPITLQSLSEYFVCVWSIFVLFACFIGGKSPAKKCEGEKMVSTKHCCWGKCTNDSRYPEKLPKSLQEMLAPGQKAFTVYPSQSGHRESKNANAGLQHAQRKYFDASKITRNTYICAVHWPGGKGTRAQHPDPLKANLASRNKKSSKLRRTRGRRLNRGLLLPRKEKGTL